MQLKKLKFLVIFFLSSLPSNLVNAADEIIIYTYDSMIAKGGLGHEIFPRLATECGVTAKVIPSGDAAEVVTRLELDRKRHKKVADIIFGFDQNLWSRVEPFVESRDLGGKERT